MSEASSKELIINQTPIGVEIALLESGTLHELHYQDNDTDFSVGDVYAGKLKRTVGSLKAAFVDVGWEKDAFLHYTDLSPQVRSLIKFVEHTLQGKQQTHLLNHFVLEPDIVKNGNIEDALNNRRIPILVQVSKEAISSKGPRLTCEITLAGRYVVLVPFSNHVSVSKKIQDTAERERLQRLAESVKPENFSVIVRTAAEGKKLSELREDIEYLISRWAIIFTELKKNKVPQRVLSEVNKTSGILRDLLNDSFKKIVVNDKNLAQNIKTYLHNISPEHEKLVTFHNTGASVFDAYKVSKQIKAAFGKTVTLPSGASLMVEHTEAMHVIDVNSGHKMGSSGTQEQNALAVNLEAASEIARQLRLRDLGGLIVIDFIDIKDPDNKAMLFRRMNEAMEADRARHTILPLTKFGIMQITRERVRPPINISVSETCPSCRGTGKAKPSLLITEEIENNLTYFVNELAYKSIRLVVHPFVEAYLKKGIISKQWKWFWQFKTWITIQANADCGLNEYRFFHGNGEEIIL